MDIKTMLTASADPTTRPRGSHSRTLLLPMITLGFATAVAMWVMGYVTHFPGVVTPPAIVAVLFVLVQIGGGIVTASLVPRRTLIVAAMAGLITSFINLLIIGSIIGSADEPNALRAGWPLMVVGTLLFGPMLNLAAAGAMIAGGRRTRSADADASIWLGRLAAVAAVSAVPVLFSGGLVTSTASGLSVPDWPASYDAMMFLFPLQDMTGGIYYEHAHRLFGSLVGLTVLAFMACALRWEPRRLVKALAVAAFALVVVQGVLGGVRVTAAVDEKPRQLVPGPDGVLVERWTLPDEGVPHNYAAAADHEGSLALAMVHGISGQMTFAFLCVLACVMAPRWTRMDRQRVPAAAHDPWLRLLGFGLPVTLLAQLSLGAGLRHFQHVGFLHTHIAMSVVVVCVAAFAGLRAASRAGEAFGPMPWLGKAIVGLVLVQFALGWATFFLVMPYDQSADSVPAIAMATLHQVTGAALLAAASMLGSWGYRLLASGRRAMASGEALGVPA